jgi:hypothetical protein
MPVVGFEPTISALEQAKTVHALDRTAIVIGFFQILLRREGSPYFRVLGNKHEECGYEDL